MFGWQDFALVDAAAIERTVADPSSQEIVPHEHGDDPSARAPGLRISANGYHRCPQSLSSRL
jgi:hypothetical protein